MRARLAPLSEAEVGRTQLWLRRPVILGRLRTMRHAQSMTQEALAQQARLPIAAIVRLEAGGLARGEEVPRLAEALGLQPEQLIGRAPR